MSTPGRSDTWCAPSGTRSSRSSRPCNSRQEGRSESTSDMRTERTRWSARPRRRPCSRKSRTHRPRMHLGCTRCFRHFTFPSTWMAVEPYAAQDSEASISSDTDKSVGPAPRVAGSAGAEGPDTQPRRGLEGEDTGAKGPEMFSPLSQGASAPGTRRHRCRGP